MPANTRAQVVSAVWAAFPDAPPPALDPSSPWPEVADAAAEIGDFTWRTAPAAVLDAVHDALTWLDAESFVYWLPGFLIDLVVDPARSDMRGYALMNALTPARASDLADRLHGLAQSHARGLFDEATYTSVVEQITTYHERVRTPMFEDRLSRLTPEQLAAVLDVLEYLAHEHARDDAAEALARWRSADSP